MTSISARKALAIDVWMYDVSHLTGGYHMQLFFGVPAAYESNITDGSCEQLMLNVFMPEHISQIARHCFIVLVTQRLFVNNACTCLSNISLCTAYCQILPVVQLCGCVI